MFDLNPRFLCDLKNQYLSSKIVILAVVSTIITGCKETTNDYSSKGVNQRIIDEGSNTLREDDINYIEFNMDRGAHVRLEATLLSGKELEIFTLEYNNFHQWYAKAQEELFPNAKFSYYYKLSKSPLTSSFTSAWEFLPKGKYILLIENTNYGYVSPPSNFKDDTATVKYTLSWKN